MWEKKDKINEAKIWFLEKVNKHLHLAWLIRERDRQREINGKREREMEKGTTEDSEKNNKANWGET